MPSEPIDLEEIIEGLKWVRENVFVDSAYEKRAVDNALTILRRLASPPTDAEIEGVEMAARRVGLSPDLPWPHAARAEVIRQLIRSET